VNGLDLGPVRFAPGASYTPPARRGRKRRGAGALRAAMQVATTDAAAGAWLSIHPDGGASYTPLLSVQPERARGALGASLASHGVFVLILFLALQSAPPEEIVAVERTIYDSIIWIPQEGPGGGGGGRGQRVA
jgi:hypothetical protein